MAANQRILFDVATEADEMTERVGRAALEGRHAEAFDLVRARMITDAFNWLEEAGIRFARVGVHTHSELLNGIADACQELAQQQGEAAGSRLPIIATLFQTLARMNQVIERMPPSNKQGDGDRLAEFAMAAGALGSVEGLMNFERLGYFEKMAEEQLLRLQRRQGADVTNAKKREAQARGLSAALAIMAINPTLSNEELALKVRERAGLNTTIKTITEWVRRWRREKTFATGPNDETQVSGRST